MAIEAKEMHVSEEGGAGWARLGFIPASRGLERRARLITCAQGDDAVQTFRRLTPLYSGQAGQMEGPD
jgi:hypothetical protein